MAHLVPGLARVVGVDTGQLYSLARDAEGGVLGVQGLLIRAALRTWQALCSSLPPASWPTGRGRQHRGQQGRQGPLQQAHQQAQGNKSEGNIYCIFTPPSPPSPPSPPPSPTKTPAKEVARKSQIGERLGRVSTTLGVPVEQVVI